MYPGYVVAGLFVGLLLIIGSALAQSGSAANQVALNGEISSISGSDLMVQSNSGPVVVKLTGDTIIRGEVPVKFSDISSGMYVGVTATKQPDGIFRASRFR